MRVKLLEDIMQRGGGLSEGTEHCVRPEIGARWIEQGRAVELLASGRVRRRRGRPRKTGGSPATAAGGSPTPPAAVAKGQRKKKG